MKRRTLARALAAALLPLSAFGALDSALAQPQPAPYPSKNIRFVVPYPPGGPTDLMARMLAPELQKRLGGTVIVDNKGGAGGNLGSAEVARQQPADGHTLLLAASGPMAVNPSLYRSMPFDPLKDLVPVTQLSAFPLVLEVHPSLGIKTVKELIALAKAGKVPLSYASAGNGTPQHLAGELFNTIAQTQIKHIPYRGAGPALQDLIAGNVDLMFDGLGSSAQHIKAGRIKALMVSGAKRNPAFPDVPCAAEVGLPDYTVTTWYGLWAPRGAPAEVQARVVESARKALAADDLRAIWAANGSEIPDVTTAAFGRFVNAEVRRWAAVVKASGTKLD